MIWWFIGCVIFSLYCGYVVGFGCGSKFASRLWERYLNLAYKFLEPSDQKKISEALAKTVKVYGGKK
jgi:hypothetical protein